jgi:uncharacterized protein involved in exopolysaccharide biosynthesis
VYRKTQAALLKYEFVLNAALRTPTARDALKAHADPVNWLAEHLTVEMADGSEVMKVRVTGLPKVEAAAVVNAVVEAYQKESAAMELQKAKQRVQKLEEARQVLQQKLTTRLESLAAKAQAAGLPPDAADHRASMAALYHERSALRVEATKGKPLKDELADVEARIRKAEEASAGLDVLRAEIARLEAADGLLATEMIRADLELIAPPRITLLHKAE